MNKEGGDDLGPMASPSAEPDGSGWLLRRDSYGFHRTFFRIVGRPALLGEYTRLCRQVRRKEAERITANAWRVTTDTGQPVVMLIRVVKGWPAPTLIFPADWRPASDHSEPPASPASSMDDRAPPPPPASGRLSLGNKTAAMALEAKLRSAGIAVRSSSALEGEAAGGSCAENGQMDHVVAAQAHHSRDNCAAHKRNNLSF